MWFLVVLCVLVLVLKVDALLLKNQRMLASLVAAGSFCNPIPVLADTSFSAELVQQGMQRFRAADVVGSVKSFDDAIASRPELSRILWQRGLSLYYADRFTDCAKQFRDDIALNPQDAEEVCLSRSYVLSAQALRFPHQNHVTDHHPPSLSSSPPYASFHSTDCLDGFV